MPLVYPSYYRGVPQSKALLAGLERVLQGVVSALYIGKTAKLRPDWDTFKYGWMVTVLQAKFSQNPRFKTLLLSTGDRVIHENCKDPWWGGGPNFPKGRDLLGKALMVVRTWLRDQEGGSC